MVSPTVDRRFGLVGNAALKAPVLVVATGNITLSGEQTIDGVAVSHLNASNVPDRVLCRGQTDATANGIYDVSTAAWSRSADADDLYDFVKGSTVFVTSGTLGIGTWWQLTTSGPIVPGTTATTWSSVLAGVNTAVATATAQAVIATTKAAAASTSETNAAASAASALASATVGRSRNRFINGGFDVDQRNEGTPVSISNSSGAFGPDRWSGIGTAASGVFTLQRIADASRPGKSRMKVSVATADASIAAGDLYIVRHRIIGYNVRDWNIGTATAKTVTVSFEIESEITGTYGIRFINAAANRCYVGTFTVNQVGVREVKTITLTLDLTGTWAIGLSTGLEVAITLAAGSTFQTTANSWQAGNFYTTSGQVNFMATIGNDLYLADMQIEQGTVTVPLVEELEYSEIERRCLFHYRKSFPRGTVPAQAVGTAGFHTLTQIVGATTAQSGHRIPFLTPMGGSPTVVTFNTQAANSQLRNIATGGNATGTGTSGDQNGIVVDFTTPGATAAGQTYAFHWTAEWEL